MRTDYPLQIAEQCAAEFRRQGGRAEVIKKPEGGYKVKVWSPLEGQAFRDQMHKITAYVCGRNGWAMPTEAK